MHPSHVPAPAKPHPNMFGAVVPPDGSPRYWRNCDGRRICACGSRADVEAICEPCNAIICTRCRLLCARRYYQPGAGELPLRCQHEQPTHDRFGERIRMPLDHTRLAGLRRYLGLAR